MEHLTLNERGKFEIKVNINGKEISMEVSPSETLLDALRRYGYKGSKKGCDSGDCGSCAVIFKGQSMVSCLMPAFMAHNSDITTIEGIGSVAKPHPIQEAFVEAGAVQCGFCIPGMIISTKNLLDKNPEPTDNEIKHALDGNLCRCTGYVKQIEAVKLAAKKLKNKKN
jgi:carbon-monoxide dehydrogenase small subunit